MAGGRATNALLDRVGSDAPRADIWGLVEPPVLDRFREWDRERFAAGKGHSVAMGALGAARRKVLRR